MERRRQGVSHTIFRAELQRHNYEKARISQLLKVTADLCADVREQPIDEHEDVSSRHEFAPVGRRWVAGALRATTSVSDSDEDIAALLPRGSRVFKQSLAAKVGYADATLLQERATVPPDGLCLSFCCVAAIRVREWLAVCRRSNGFIIVADEEFSWKNIAQAFLGDVVALMEIEGSIISRAC